MPVRVDEHRSGFARGTMLFVFTVANGRRRCLNYSQIRSNQPSGAGDAGPFRVFKPFGILSDSTFRLAFIPPRCIHAECGVSRAFIGADIAASKKGSVRRIAFQRESRIGRTNGMALVVFRGR